MKRTKSSRGITGSSFVVPALALLIFSLKQSENWLMGFQVAFFLNVVTLTAGIILLARSGFSWWRFLAAVLLGVVASYSTINGLLYWFVALPVLLTLPFQNPRTRRICIMLWLLAAVVVINSYFYNYQTPPSKTPGNFALTHPTEFATYFLCYLGNPVGPNHILATALAGLFGLFILFVTAVLLVRARYLSLQQLAPYLSLAFYSIGSALFTTISRAGYGVLQAKVSRYVTFANLLWAAVFILLYLLVTISMAESRKSTAPRRRKRAVAAAALIAFLGIVLAAGQSSVKSVPVFRDWRAQLAPARAALLSTRDPELLRPIYPRDPNMPIRQIPFLEEHRLSVFREAQYGADTD